MSHRTIASFCLAWVALGCAEKNQPALSAPIVPDAATLPVIVPDSGALVSGPCDPLQVIQATNFPNPFPHVPRATGEAAVEIEYFAQTRKGEGDSEVLLVVRDLGPGRGFLDVRVFYGPPNAIQQRKLVDLLRGRDGGTTSLHFLVDRVLAVAHFPIACRKDGGSYRGPWCDGTLFLNGGERVFEQQRLPLLGGLPAGLRFSCGAE